MSMFHELMMRKKGGGVEYKTLVYATDNAYIQTDISANDDYKIKITGTIKTQTYTNAGSNYFFDGAYFSFNLTGTIAFIGYNPGNKNVTICLRSGNNQASYQATYKNDITVGSNGTVTQPNYTLSLEHTIPYNKNFGIFRCENENNYSNDLVAISLIEIKDQNNNLIAELKPAIVNGESGMYDTVGQQFYANANSVGSLVCE